MLYDKRWDTKIDTPVDEVGQLLLDGADMIRKIGHAKHAIYHSTKGGVCFMGAMMAARSREKENYRGSSAVDMPPGLMNEAGKRVSVVVGCGSFLGDVVNWNNRPDTTAEDVISAMEKAAFL